MTHRQTVALAASVAFAGGLAMGLAAASKRGRAVSVQVGKVARAQARLVETRLHALQDQLRALERQVEAAGGQALARYVPAAPDEAEGWEVERDEMARELPHLPRG